MNTFLRKIVQFPKMILLHSARTVFGKHLSNPFDYLKIKKDLKENRKYMNIYENERCFVLGNGPSLKKQNLKFIKNEHIFVVNSFVFSPLFSYLQPEFFVTWDDVQFDWENKDYGAERRKLFEIIQKSNWKITSILPLRFKQKIERTKYLDSKNILYAYWGAFWDKYDEKFNFESQIPSFNNVVHLTIMAAIYMGFKEIYLLGVDMTDFLSLYEYSWNNMRDEKYEYFYKCSKIEKKLRETVYCAEDSNEYRLKIVSNKLMYFRKIEEIAKKNNVKIINLTEGGGLDVFPREKYSEWVKKM